MDNINSISIKSLSADEIKKIEEFRKSKQTAVLAILFSDVVNSTFATEKLGEQTYSQLRHIHDELFIQIMCRSNAGIIIKEIGDSFLCVFAEPSTAVLRAVEFQRAILSNKENLTIRDYTLTVKIGIHVGQVAVESSLAMDIFGRHVNRASRIVAIANGGQILTSRSIWENAVGWLTDNEEEKIGWVFYGKTKLKGIEERVDIFGFYPKQIGKPPAPKIFRKQKQNRLLLLLLTFLALVGLLFFILPTKNQKKGTQETAGLIAAKKQYYVQFSLSSIDYKKFTVDTSALKESLLAQIIAVFHSDSVITESDLMKLSTEKGKLYVKHNTFDHNYFKDSLGFSGVFFIEINTVEPVHPDSVALIIRSSLYPPASTTLSSLRARSFSLKNIESDFRKNIQDILIDVQMAAVQGSVLTFNDSILLFHFNKNSRLRVGAKISFSRFYSGQEGLDLFLEDVKKKLDYLKDKPQYTEDFKRESSNYQHLKNSLAPRLKGGASYGEEIGLTGKVIELYDSIGKATWTVNGPFLLEKPKKGDKVYLSY